MIITPTTRTIQQLLSSSCQFNIPRFQREYSWEKSHYKEFINDIVNGLVIDDRSITCTPYFLGTMLYIGSLDVPGSTLDVVDGQQRLTIITILFSALSDHFKQIGKPTLSERLFEYIMTRDDNGDPVRVLKSSTHYPFFSYYIQDINKTNVQPPVSEEENGIKETYEFLFEETSEAHLRVELAKKYSDELVNNISYEDILKAVRDQVLQSLVVIVTTRERTDANVIFEILNAKGKHLASVDLIKNRIFSVLKATEPADYADITWNSIKKKLYDCQEMVGMAAFFRHYWVSKYSACTENTLYGKFRGSIKKENYHDFLEDLKQNAGYYMQVVNPNRMDYGNKKQYYWLVQSFEYLSHVFNIVQIRMPMMAMLEARDRRVITAKQFKKVVQYIEGFHFVYNCLLARKSNVLDSPYSVFARELRKCDNADAAQVQIELLMEKLEGKYPSFEEFKNVFVELKYSKTDDPDNMKSKYVINKLACFYSRKTTEVFFSDGSIEHIYPESNPDENVKKIGNLILLEETINNDAGQKAYENKRSDYERSSYDWVRQFVSDNQTWEIGNIQDRASRMAETYYYEILKRTR